MRTLLGLLILIAIIVGVAYSIAPESIKEYAWTFAPLVLDMIKKADVPPSLPEKDNELPFVVPDGFSVSVFAKDLGEPRDMARDPRGTLVVSLLKEGKIVALPDHDQDGKADTVITILENLTKPHGILFLCGNTGNTSVDQDTCRLYVAEENVVQSYAYDSDTFTASLPRDIASLPSDGGHSTRTLLAHPDGKRLLVSVGSSCNVCEERDARRAKILAVDIEAGAFGAPTDFARGLRNTVFMTIHPVTGEIWGTDMGRDLLGDNIPPDEVNIIAEGGNYGWPICYGKNIHDTQFDKKTYIRNPCTEPLEIASHLDIPAHSAPLGLAFVPEEGWPEDYWHDLLIAYHGSWNRSEPAGYSIVRFELDPQGNKVAEEQDFMTGFRSSDQIIGRPVDILIEPGGTLYVSDDRAGAIYRVFRDAI